MTDSPALRAEVEALKPVVDCWKHQLSGPTMGGMDFYKAMADVEAVFDRILAALPPAPGAAAQEVTPEYCSVGVNHNQVILTYHSGADAREACHRFVMRRAAPAEPAQYGALVEVIEGALTFTVNGARIWSDIREPFSSEIARALQSPLPAPGEAREGVLTDDDRKFIDELSAAYDRVSGRGHPAADARDAFWDLLGNNITKVVRILRALSPPTGGTGGER